MSIVGQTAVIDLGVMEALARYLAYGLDPGSFGKALLRGDTEEAYRCAHPLLHREEDQELGGRELVDIIPTMLLFTESAIPAFARGEDIDRWMEHRGLSGAPESIRAMAKLGIENYAIWNYVQNKHADAISGKMVAAA